MSHIYLSSTVGSAGYAAVFEADDETSYFYLLDQNSSPKIKQAIPIHFGKPDFSAEDVNVFWGPGDESIILTIRGQPVAAFDVLRIAAYGGLDGMPLPPELRKAKPSAQRSG